ncbi:DUF5916 domain-containing protein [Ascidiimonas sp. W6]|uniref:DUF5916 domain-containing protein n=1 Tax=Ascidiimonas meishanensis TaxID=3128903 RepID=UPI0030ED5347
MIKTLLILLLLGFFCNTYSQENQKEFLVKFTDSSLILDGSLEEVFWLNADSAKDFYQYFPTDSVLAKSQTTIKMLYDNAYLYIGIAVETLGDNYVIPSLQRDFRAGGNDNISLLFDTFNDGTNAFLFGVNPAGVQREALISAGGSELRGFNTTWDVKWKSAVNVLKNGYSAEIVIPLTSFKFKEGETKWRFNSYRFDTQGNEQSTWMRIPQNQFIFNLAFMGNMKFERPLGKSRTPFTLIPYVNTALAKDYEENESLSELNVGGDAKIAIGNGMNMDVTFNPDFSNVEVDNLVTNLTRFEIGLPERRQFFIDNSDLFADFGDNSEANPFFSRRIGISENAEGNNIQNGIIGGIRLSGKLNRNWRLGFLNIQTEEDQENEIPTNNNMVLALQKKVFSRSNLGFIFVNRQSFNEYSFLTEAERYNRVVGLDFNLASADNTWIGKFYTHKSFTPESGNKDFSTGARLFYNSRFYQAGISGRYVGADFNSDLGFIRRKDVFVLNPEFTKILRPIRGIINNHEFSVNSSILWRPDLDFQNTDYTHEFSWEAEFNNQIEISAGLQDQFIFLAEDFDPTDTEDAAPLPLNTSYKFTQASASFRSDRRKVFAYEVNLSGGEFFNGSIYSIAAQTSLRLQPIFFTSITVNYDQINLPDPYPDAKILIVSPRFEVTFNKSLFWTTIVQFSNRNENLGLNTRLQWRFAPLSDLFIVYNDNYRTNNFAPRNRSLNIKLTYWLNI